MNLFFAIRFDDASVSCIRDLRALLDVQSDTFTQIPDDTLHLTLRHLGSVSEHDVSTTRESLHRLVGMQAHLHALRSNAIICLPSPSAMRVVALRVQDDAALLALTEAFRSIDITHHGVQRPFLPHVTLARVQQGAHTDHPLKLREEADRIMRVQVPLCVLTPRDVVLFRSDHTAHGTRYVPIASEPLET